MLTPFTYYEELLLFCCHKFSRMYNAQPFNHFQQDVHSNANTMHKGARQLVVDS